MTTVRFVPQVGSAATIPLPPMPTLHLHATATPSANLVDGQKVTVRWSGYTPGAVVNILECAPSVVQSNSSSACNFSGAKILTPDPTGHGSVQLPDGHRDGGDRYLRCGTPGLPDRRQQCELNGVEPRRSGFRSASDHREPQTALLAAHGHCDGVPGSSVSIAIAEEP